MATVSRALARHVSTRAWITVAATAMVGCNLGVKYSVGGTLNGLIGQGLVLEINKGDDLRLSTNGAFVFSRGIKNGESYSVTVKTQPSNPSQTCTVSNGSGTISKADVTSIIVYCTQAGRFAYVANRLSNNVSGFSINSANGFLTPIPGSPFPASGTAPVSLAVDPNGRFLYVVSNGSNDVAVYAIDNSTGVLSSAGLSATGSGPEAVAIDLTDSYLYVANFASNNISAYAISSTTGLLTEVAGSPFATGVKPSSLKIDPNGSFLYVANFGGGNVDALAIDPATGALSRVSGAPFAAGAGPVSIAIDPAGTFAYVANSTAATISEYSINASTGVLAPVAGPPSATATSPESLAVDPGRPLPVRRKCYRQKSGVRLSAHAGQRRIERTGLAGSGRHIADQYRARSLGPFRLCRQRQFQ